MVNGPAPLRLPSRPAPPVASTISHTMAALLRNIELRGGHAGRWLRMLVHGAGQLAVQAGQLERVAVWS